MAGFIPAIQLRLPRTGRPLITQRKSALPIRTACFEGEGVARKFGFNPCFPARGARAYRNSVQNAGGIVRFSQFECRVSAQVFAAPEESASFVDRTMPLFATCLYRTSVRSFRIPILPWAEHPEMGSAPACSMRVRRMGHMLSNSARIVGEKSSRSLLTSRQRCAIPAP